MFLPGDTTAGHYQIELACGECHGSSFPSASDIQDSCMRCHGQELKLADDSHPKKKFTDPRNADRVQILDARYCVTCHREHVPEQTGAMGLSLPADYCYHCHVDVGEERPTHQDLPFDGCAAAGCHNFHDNRALYEDFLVANAGQPVHLPQAVLRARTPIPAHAAPLDALAHDAPRSLGELARWVDDWKGTSHAAAGVNCSDCHAPAGTPWSDAVAIETCADCHEGPAQGFLASRHGMRVAAGLGKMRPALARLPFHDDAGERELDCASCHREHGFDTRFAAADACLECHADDHSLAWEASPHGLAWGQERGEGVSCATCHLPRTLDENAHVVVQHNQNDNLRPNEKMIRPVCMQCHGLGFSIDALADLELVERNFAGRPVHHVESIDMAVGRVTNPEERKSP